MSAINLIWLDDLVATRSSYTKPKLPLPTVADRDYLVVPALDKPWVALVQPDFERGPWIAGGAPLRWFGGQTVGLSDIDVFFRNDQQYQHLYKTLIDDYKFLVRYSSINATTLVLEVPGNSEIKIQLINKRFYNSVDEIFASFDMTIAQVATDGDSFRFGHPQTVHDINRKLIRLTREAPTDFARVIKYMAYGYAPVGDTYDQALERAITSKAVFEDDYDQV